MTTVEVGRTAEGMDASGADNAGECQIAATEDKEDIGAMEEDSREETRRTPAEEDSFYTMREIGVTGLTTSGGRRAMSEAPSVASPFKPRRQNIEQRGRRERITGGVRGLGAGEQMTTT